MSTPGNVIKVPRPARGSFNKHRPLDPKGLIKMQVLHFNEAENQLPPEQRTGIPAESITTEGQAADYIRRVTAALHPEGARKGKVRRAT